MVPPFDIAGGAALTAARAASVAALLSVFGALVFRAYVVPRSCGKASAELQASIIHRLRRLTRVSAALYGLATLAWLLLQAADMASSTSVAQAIAALPTVVVDTMFGHVVILQFIAINVAVWLDRSPRPWAAIAGATAAVALQAGHSHAASMYSGPSVLLAVDVLHLVAAGAWLGGLLPLLLVVRDAPHRTAASAARWFSPLGQLCLIVLTGTAAFQGWVLIASIPGLVGTAYGWMAIAKLGLFGILFAFAVTNRYVLAPPLLGHDPAPARRRLMLSIAVQTGFGLAIVGAAALLSNLEPAMHVQPLWPFAKRLTLDTVNEDAGFRNELIGAGLALAFALLLLVASLVWRRLRWPGLAASIIIAWLAVPHLDLLLADAEPTYYYRSPTGFASTSIVAGADLYGPNCALCHGSNGGGDGPAAASLPVPPANLLAAHLWMHDDGELFWWISHGIQAPEGGQAMPGFASALSDDERWALIDFIRARNAGQAAAGSGSWPMPVQAPGLQATCDGRIVSLGDLRGRFIRLVFGPPQSASPGALTIVAGADPLPGECSANDESLPRAYSIVSGIPVANLPGTQFLIDGDGWLRAKQRTGQPGGWTDPAALAAEIQALKRQPVAASAADMPMDMKM